VGKNDRMETPLDGLWIINADAKTVYASDRMAEMLGTTPSEMKGHPSFDYVFPEDVPAAQRLFEAKMKGDRVPFHFRLRREDGSAIWVNVQGTPLHNAAGDFRGIVGSFTVSTDQTARK
jgi:PAS domain S-box-containing protein